MPKITKITRQQRNKSRVSVFIDDEFAFGIDESSIYSLELRVGEEITPERQKELEEGVLASSARTIAQRYLARSMRTTKEVRQRLKEKGIPPRVIHATLEWLAEYGLLNDEEYAQSFIRTRMRLRPASTVQLRRELMKKGIPASIVEETLSDRVDENYDKNTAVELARSYAAKNGRLDPQTLKRRLAGYLQRRGFRSNEVFTAIDAVLNDSRDDS